MVQRIENVQDPNCCRDAKQTLLVELQSNGCGGHSTHRGDTPENDPNYFTSESTFYTSGVVPLTVLQRNTHKISSNSDYIQKAGPISKIWGRGEDWEAKTLATRVWGPEFGSPESVEIRRELLWRLTCNPSAQKAKTCSEASPELADSMADCIG